jgi:hypothetical protein
MPLPAVATPPWLVYRLLIMIDNASPQSPKEFFIWVDPQDWMVKHNIGLIGGIGQEPPPDIAPADLAFVYNPNHKLGFVSRFHIGIIHDYSIEYDLE